MSSSDSSSNPRGTASGSATASPQTEAPAAAACSSGPADLFLNEVATTMATHVQLLADALDGCSADQWCRLAWVMRESCRMLGLRADMLNGLPLASIGDAQAWADLDRGQAAREGGAQ